MSSRAARRGLNVPVTASAQALVDLMNTPTGPDGLSPAELTAWSIRERGPAGQERWSRDSSAKAQGQVEVATLAELSAMRYLHALVIPSSLLGLKFLAHQRQYAGSQRTI